MIITLQTLKNGLGSVCLALAACAFLNVAAQAQSITVSLAIGSAACDYPVDVQVATSGLAPNNTLASATVDVLYDFTTVHPLGSPASTIPLSFPPYAGGVSLLPDLCTPGTGAGLGKNEGSSGVDCNAVRLTITSSNLGEAFGDLPGTDIAGATNILSGLCFGANTTSTVRDGAVTAKAQVAPSTTSFQIDTTTLSVSFYNSPNNSNDTDVKLDCRTPPQSTGTIGFDCTLPDEGLLPVELTDFEALVNNGSVTLNWATASETDNAGFSIEHAEGTEGLFEEIDFVEGAGTSLERRTYTYTVNALEVGVHRFRLKQLDYDGAFSYSKVLETTIELAGTHRLDAAYPNPFNPSTTFELVVGREQHVRIDIINALGQRVQRLFDGSMEANKPTNFTFHAGTLPTGLYFYRVIGENFAQTRQVLLVK